MAYTVPRVEIEQEFVQTPIFANNPLSAFIFGPNYRPLRYEVASEKSKTYIGDYVDSTAGIALTSYPWLTTHTSDIAVDASKNTDGTFAHLTPYIEGAPATYFANGVASLANGLTPSTAATVTALTVPASDGSAVTPSDVAKYYTNKLKFNVYLKEGVNPTTGQVYPRSSYFSNRDVQVGDLVTVTGPDTVTPTPGTSTITAKIIEIIADPVTGEYNIAKVDKSIFANAAQVAGLIDPYTGSLTACTIKLHLVKSTQFPNSKLLDTTSATQVGVKSGLTVTDALFIETGKTTPANLPVATGATLPVSRVYVSYRVLRTDNAVKINSLNDPAQVEAVLGVVTPENPLAEGVYDALLNAAGTSVYYMAIPTDDLAGYNAVLEQAKRTNVIYGMVPLTTDSAVIDAVKSHVTTMSTSANAKWRKLWISLSPTASGILAGYDVAGPGNLWTIGTPVVDPQAGGVNKVFVTIASNSGSINPSLITNGVRAGDLLRVYTGNALTGSVTDYTIKEVRSQSELVTSAEIASTGTVAIQIIRNYTNDEQVAMLGAASGNDRRVNAVFPPTAKTNGVVKAGYFVAAALAGLRAGSVPHRPLTNVELLGFDDFTTTLVTFTPTQLDTLASYGYWIMVQDTVGGVPYVRHQLTTQGYTSVGEDPKFSEDSITTNVDSVSYGLQRALSPFIGKYNVNPATLALVNAAVVRQLHYQMLAATNSPSGPQLLGYTIKSIGKSTLFKDRIEASIELELPYPLNRITISLVVP